MPDSTKPKVRFAPSPTGFLHLGGVRTALFNWLYARSSGGSFVLRVEDTDAARNTAEATDFILDGMRWCGLDWDEGPYFQSQRVEIYESHLKKLLDAELAYTDPDGATRFRVPDEEITVEDGVCGSVTTNLVAQGSKRWDPEQKKEVESNPDIVIRRADGSFLFHFVNVVDDIEMGITHVIRGEDHLPNTPKHIALFRALGAEIPQFSHLPLILTKEGKKLSKRDAGAGLSYYMDNGFIAEGVVNYLVLLGWSPKDDQEMMTLEEMVGRFDVKGINRSNAKFDLDKCVWFSGQYLAKLAPGEFTSRALPFVRDAGIPIPAGDEESAGNVLPLIQEKVRLLSEVPEWVDYFFKDDCPTDPAAAEKAFAKDGSLDLLAAAETALSDVDDWEVDPVQNRIMEMVESKGVKLGAIMPGLRVALSGRLAGPGVFEMMVALGKERSLNRIRAALETIAS